MSFTEVKGTIPSPARSSAKARKFTTEELDAVVALLEEGKSVTDDVVYSKKDRQRLPRDCAYYKGYDLRAAILAHTGDRFRTGGTDDSPKFGLRVRTWVDEKEELTTDKDGNCLTGGYKWALQEK